ncbi:hypothetical protein MNBD_GAMMA26-1519 [hydrothermal vent metagenome]|uniref:Uncharacterized protein n=1 Tax=hydrothermal vent metagenome TaxID=652676 RepID=A0A3B1BVH0_9ZZZZ
MEDKESIPLCFMIQSKVTDDNPNVWLELAWTSTIFA